MLKGNEELGNCGARDGSTVQVVSRLQSEGKLKDKKCKSEKKQDANPKNSELVQRQEEERCEEEQKSDDGPVAQRGDKESAMRQLEESEGYQKIIDCV